MSLQVIGNNYSTDAFTKATFFSDYYVASSPKVISKITTQQISGGSRKKIYSP